ncbi:MAG: hypothetical protein AVO33_03580 [delta proteobacterium ML8_F1]|nr:MAG: hypothetical protein AVO33_03580 [delta proteobacterium ML8_F1]
MREKILKLLRETPGDLSGEKISEYLGVSRTAVWKQIKALKDIGYVIETKAGSGYRLKSAERPLNQEELRLILGEAGVFTQAYYHPSIDSTNAWAKTLSGREGTLIVASEQTSGRGRLGREWISPRDKGLYVSFKLHPSIHPEKAMMLTQIAALGILKGLKQYCGIEVAIKWPNDLVVAGRKLVGILTEMTTEIEQVEKLVIGFGINLYPMSLPEEVLNRAVALEELMDGPIDGLILIQKILENFTPLYLKFLKVQDLSFVIEELNRYSAVVDRDLMVIENGESVPCHGSRIDKTGRLWVRDPSGKSIPLNSGEVSVRGTESYI